MGSEQIGLVIGILAFLISVGTTVFFAGKWIGAKEYLTTKIKELEEDIKEINTEIKAIRKESMNDRHNLRKELLDKMGEYWREVTQRMKWVDKE